MHPISAGSVTTDVTADVTADGVEEPLSQNFDICNIIGPARPTAKHYVCLYAELSVGNSACMPVNSRDRQTEAAIKILTSSLMYMRSV